jgi:hypothetical protein
VAWRASRAWLEAEPLRPIALALLLELAAGVALMLGLSRGPGALVGVLCLWIARVWFALRARQASWVSSLASLLAMLFAGCAAEGISLALALSQRSMVWSWVPALMGAYLLILRPRVGLAFVGGLALAWAPWIFGWELARSVRVVAIGVALGLALIGRARRSVTFAIAAVIVVLGSDALHAEQLSIDRLHDHISFVAWSRADALARMGGAAAMIVLARYVLAERTWAMLALAAVSTAYAQLPAPGIEQWRGMQWWSIHPLDTGAASALPWLALLLLITWAVPIARWLRTEPESA